jgi:hypothetical protein
MSFKDSTQDISDDAPEQNPDTYVLLQSVEGMLDLIETQATYYNDARKRLVERHLYQPKLSIVTLDPIYVAPETDHRLWKEKMKVLSARLRQLGNEREAAQRDTQAAFEELKDENQHLRDELTRLRKEYMIPRERTNSSISHNSGSVFK